jgi:hypothetical protein
MGAARDGHGAERRQGMSMLAILGVVLVVLLIVILL